MLLACCAQACWLKALRQKLSTSLDKLSSTGPQTRPP
ncbi:hypothetical protein Leryth_027348 [Lithospermum erythrorhizon]|nr:hypothetical protein Leryth_027348 [Lithospermum erythrorhizon]